nr:MAG TPA: hypothetical protein [Caudoviricetes sp.]DAH78283.1 MAG TPA: hypothetical protein [Caudoviricetes sp.]
MDEQNMAAISEEEDVMMPDGYGTGDDFFADEWTGQDADAQPEPEQEAEPEKPKEDAPTTEQPEEDHEAQEPEAETPEDAPRRLRFKARVDREDMDVDIGEDEVPALYQLAKAGERWKAKNDTMRQQVEHYEQMAKGMGYATVDEMIQKTAEGYKSAKVQELMEQGTPQTIAEDYVDRMMQREAAKAPDPEPEEPTPEAHERNIQAEAQELIVARPDLKTRQLPMEVVEAWRNGENLLNAYNRYEARQKEAENQKLKKENNILKQNAAAAAKAPVKGVTGGAPTDTEPEDPFLKGFDSDPW